MDYFCQECSGKPGWPWNDAKVFMHSCQRCFRMLPCNDFAWRKPQVAAGPAPRPKDLVATDVNQHAQVDLPRAKGTPPPPAQPVYEVEPPAMVAPPSIIPKSENRNEVDMALDAVQPNRPGVKLNTVDKAGRPMKPAKQVAAETEAP